MTLKPKHGLPRRRSFHRFDFFLLFCQRRQRLLSSIAIYVFRDFQFIGREPSR